MIDGFTKNTHHSAQNKPTEHTHLNTSQTFVSQLCWIEFRGIRSDIETSAVFLKSKRCGK